MIEETIEYLPLDCIDTEAQVRDADDQAIPVLAENLKQNGLLQPIRVRPKPNSDRYVLITGERRLRALRTAGCQTIRTIVDRRDLSEVDIVIQQLSENLARRALKPMESARAMKKLINMGVTRTEITTRLGFHTSTISQLLALNSLPEDIQRKVESGEIPRSTAYGIKVHGGDKKAALADGAAKGELKRDDVKTAARCKQSAAKPKEKQPRFRMHLHTVDGDKFTVSGRKVLLEALALSFMDLASFARECQEQGIEFPAFVDRVNRQEYGRKSQ
jgi:ParB family chromosome partitioning protein